jgi:hypothetical protein
MSRYAIRLFFLIVVFATQVFSGFAQDISNGQKSGFTDAFLDNLAGEWNLTRAIRGQTVRSKVVAKWVLNHQFLRVEMDDGKTPSEYSATIYIGYDNSRKSYVVHWIDVFGGTFSETLGYGKREGNKIVFLFDYPDGPFRNTFTWDEKQKSWDFLMQNGDRAGSWRLFAEDKLTRG